MLTREQLVDGIRFAAHAGMSGQNLPLDALVHRLNEAAAQFAVARARLVDALKRDCGARFAASVIERHAVEAAERVYRGEAPTTGTEDARLEKTLADLYAVAPALTRQSHAA